LSRFRFLSGVFTWLAVCLVGGGCGSPEPVKKEADVSYQHLTAIKRAYIKATEELGRPPESAKDILPYINYAGGAKEELLRSPEDGQEYKILWGVDVRELMQPDDQGQYPVLAYEQQGKDGRRYVLAIKTITQMTDEQLKKAPFPPGHQNPF
jgi:hypothetical protein